jgi:hypothetical protein
MIGFVAAFTLVYFCIHLGAWLPTSAQLGLSLGWRLAGVAACVLLTFSIYPAFMLPGPLSPGLARAYALAAWLWFGVVGYLFLWQTALLAPDLLARVWPSGFGRLWPDGGMRLLLALTLTLATVGWGLVEAAHVRMSHHAFASPRIVRSVRLVFLSDVHLDVIRCSAFAEALVERVNNLEPDWVLVGGDLWDRTMGDREAAVQALRGLTARAYGVFGNHEHYAGVEASRAFYADAGIELIHGTVVELGDSGVVLAGVDDSGHGHGPPKGLEDRLYDILARQDRGDRYTVLMNHQPRGWETARHLGVDLQLSGHTHAGQMFPFRWLVALAYEHWRGLHEQDGKRLLVGLGAGTWGPPLRVLAPPEIIVLDLMPEGRATSEATR